MKKLAMLIISMMLTCPVILFAQITPFDGIVVDKSGTHNGSFGASSLYGIKIGGAGSGEGIISSRSGGTNINGLDFYTNYIQRLRILSNGNVGIGTYATPTTMLSFGPYSGTNGVSDIGNMRLSIFDYKDVMRYGIGYYEESGVSFPLYKRVFAFYANNQGRFGFFDNYSSSSTDKTNGTGFEFVSFEASSRSVGIGNVTPQALLHVKSTTGSTALAIFESPEQTTNITSRLRFTGNSQYGSKNYIDGYSYNKSTTTQTSAPLYLQALSGNYVGVGSFPYASSTQYFTPNSLFHVQNGNVQITNSGAPALVTDVTKYGLTMGFNGNTTKATTDYSWVQSSNGPLLLNPRSGNTLTTQTNNYVAIGLKREDIIGTVGSGYNLLVGGKILCEELKIKLNSGATWYDYVLKPDYKLMSLDSLESFISQNSHLPDVPSEAEVKENGIMAGEMNGILLKKIEELTLYMIQQDKNNAAQTEQIELLKKQNELLMQQLLLLNQATK